MSRFLTDKQRKRAKQKRKALFRLLDLDTEEVSFVDAAANEEDFLVVKSEGDKMGKELTEGKDGELTDTKKVLTPSIKQAVVRAMESIAGRLTSVLDAVKASPIGNEEPTNSIPSTVGRPIASLLAEIMAIPEKFPMSKAEAKDEDYVIPDIEGDAIDWATVSKAVHSISAPVKAEVTKLITEILTKTNAMLTKLKAAPTADDGGGLDAPMAQEMKSLGAMLKAILDKHPLRVPKVTITQAGDKKTVTKKQMDEHIKVFKNLDSFLDNLSTEIVLSKSQGQDLDALDGKRSATNGKQPNGGAGHQSDLSVVSTFEESIEDPQLRRILKAEIAKQVKAGVKTELDKIRGELTSTKKSLNDSRVQVSKQARKIKTLESETPTPNGFSEGGERKPVKKNRQFAWAGDLNGATEKELREDGLYFGDDEE